MPRRSRERISFLAFHMKNHQLLNFFVVNSLFSRLSLLTSQISYPIDVLRNPTRNFSILVFFSLPWWLILSVYPPLPSLWSRSFRSCSSCGFYNFRIQLTAEWQKQSNHANLSRARENGSRSPQTCLCHLCPSAVPLSVRPQFQSCLPDLPPYCQGLFPMHLPTIQQRSVQCLVSHLSKSFSRKQR